MKRSNVIELLKFSIEKVWKMIFLNAWEPCVLWYFCLMFLFFPIYFISILHRGFTESIKHTEDNKAHRKRKYSKGNSYSLMRGK